MDYASYSSYFYTEEVNGPFIEVLSINISFLGIRELPAFCFVLTDVQELVPVI